MLNLSLSLLMTLSINGMNITIESPSVDEIGKITGKISVEDNIISFVYTTGLCENMEGHYLYSINEGYYRQFSPGIQKYLDHCKDNDENSSFSARYIGSLVADFHRNLLKGGIYMYPSTKKQPGGKLRLLYEANPIWSTESPRVTHDIIAILIFVKSVKTESDLKIIIFMHIADFPLRGMYDRKDYSLHKDQE